MRKMTVADVMTRELITVVPDAPYKDIVDFIVGEGISAVPVVAADGRPVGVVSEADLLRKEEHLDDDPDAGPSPFALPATRQRWRKAAGLTARELMTSPVRTVRSDAELPSAARELARSGVRRLFVVDEDRLVGVLSRRDLLRGFLRGDNEIRADIEREVLVRNLWADLSTVQVTVRHGVVTLTGRLEYQAEVELAGLQAKAIPGVIAVHNRLGYLWTGESRRPDASHQHVG